MKHLPSLVAALCSLLLAAVPGAARADGKAADFADFDRRAREGAPLSVVFFGGSLTWGANASDPQRTSYRGLMMDYLRERYPRASFAFTDAAIGGTGSQLGMFRLERDVLSRKPDLVFLDFTVNDGPETADPHRIASYEGVLRDTIGRGIPVVQAYFGAKYHYYPYAPEKLPGYQQRLQLAGAYHTGVGDALPYIHGKLESGEAKPEAIWAFDGTHPDDPGYALFFQAVRDGFERAVAAGTVCIVPPQPVFSDAYRVRTRQALVDGTLPPGWERARTYRTSLWFDGLSSRWMGDVAMCDLKNRAAIQPLRAAFTGTFVGLFGEADQDGLGFQVRIDGKPVPYQPDKKAPPSDVWSFDTKKMIAGRLFMWRVLADDLAPGRHQLEIDPVFPDGAAKGQLRIESVCSAGE